MDFFRRRPTVAPSLSLLIASVFVPALQAQLPGQMTNQIPGQSTAGPSLQPRRLAVADPYAAEAIVIERNETSYRMHADGTGERTQHERLRLQSEGAVRQFSVLSFSYAAASETPHLTMVRVHKPNGTSIDTPTADAIEMPAPVTRESPLYSDLKEKQVPVRSLAVGDTLEYEVRTTIDKPEAPGQFWGADHFTAPGTLVVLAEVYTLEVPKDKYVQVWSPNHTPVRTEHGNLVTYTWTVAQLLPTPTQGDDAKSKPPKDPDQDAQGRLIPSLAYTTFHNWAEVGDWYRGLAAARAEPNDALRAKANDLTRNAATPEEQARALYRFVSGIRYVGIDLGVGRFQPHPAAEVLQDQYGDCKDKDTLLEALMRAKGLHPAPALIGAGITPLPDVPTPAVFNHVITTVDLPGTGRVWMDSTAETATFRLLNPVIRDEEALVVPPAAPAELVKTPADAPYPLFNRFDATGTLTADGLFKAHVDMIFHSDDEAPLRQGLEQLAPAQWDAGVQYLSSSMGFRGKTSNADLHQKDPEAPLHLSFDYTREKYSDWSNLRILPLAPGVALPEPDPDEPAPSDVNLGAKGSQIASFKLTLPAGYRADLPDGVHATSPWATFDKTYRLTDGVLTFDRKIEILATKVPKADLAAYSAFLKKISNGQDFYIQLTAARHLVIVPETPAAAKKSAQPPSATLPAPDASTAHKPAASGDPQELVKEAMQMLPAMDWPGATALLDQAKDISESTPFLWAGYGVIQAAQNHFAASIPLFRRELARHPDEGGVVVELSAALKGDKQDEAARTVLSDYFREHTDDRLVGLTLAGQQAAAHHTDQAAETLRQLSLALPKDEAVKVQLANTLLLEDKKPEAAKAAREALEAAEPDDSGTLNDASYALAEAGTDLPLAEQSSRKAVSLLEAKSLTLTPEEVNSRSYADANLLVASWDTLGYILLAEGKLDDALNWFQPAWRDSQHPEVGLHLGQVYEKLGKPKEALTSYRLALASQEGAREDHVIAELRADVTRLHGSSNESKDREELTEERMFRFKRPSGLNGSGTYRLLLASSGVVGLQQVSGDAGMKAAEPAMRAMTFLNLIPSGSAVHLLRRIVVSCHSGDTCQLVFVPNGSLAEESN